MYTGFCTDWRSGDLYLFWYDFVDIYVTFGYTFVYNLLCTYMYIVENNLSGFIFCVTLVFVHFHLVFSTLFTF